MTIVIPALFLQYTEISAGMTIAVSGLLPRVLNAVLPMQLVDEGTITLEDPVIRGDKTSTKFTKATAN